MISVIVPIFNVEQYLSKCVDSLLSQSYKDLEIILVDDGSTDHCPTFCDEYAKIDNRVIVIHKINGGLSDARNVGMKIVHGEWIFFLDADDWIDNNALEVLYHFAVDNDCDIVQGNFYYTYNDHLLYRCESRREHVNHILNRSEAMKELIINERVKNFAWGKLYKTSLVKTVDFPIGKFFEDSFWQHLIIHRTNKYGIVEDPLYYYRQREDSISGILTDRYDDLIEGYKHRLEFIEINYPQYTDLMRRMYRKIYELKYPKQDLRSYCSRFFARVKDKFFPVSRFKRIEL